MCNQAWEISVGDFAKPILFINKPKLTHSVSKGATSFSFEVYERPFAPWTVTEKAKVLVRYKGEEMFLGNIVSRSTDWNTKITSYGAVGYYIHTRREPITKKYSNPFQVILSELLEDSKAKLFISNISYKIGNLPDSDTDIKTIFLERQYVGQYLDSCLDDLCKAVGCQWFIDPVTGFLVIWQASKIVVKREIDVDKLQVRQCQTFKFSELKPNFIQPEISRVVVARDPDSIRFRNIPQTDSINNYQILPNSPEQSVNLLKKTGIVKNYFINPAAVNCDFLELDPSSSSFDFNAASSSFDVIVNDSCAWTAATEDDWITITSGSSGAGNNPVNFSVAANTFTTSRSGSIEVNTSGASATHIVFQDGDPDGTAVACDAVFFVLDEVDDDGDPDNVFLIDPPRPKRIGAGAYLTPLVSPGIHTNETEGSYTASYGIILDLTDPNIGSLSSLKLRYSVQAIGLSNGDSSTSGGGPYPSPAYNSTATLTVDGVDEITSHVEYAGGELFGPYNQTDSKTSGPFGPFFDLDITDKIGTVVNITFDLDVNLFPDPVKGFPPGAANTYASQAGCDLIVLCTA